MSLTIDLPGELERALAAEAERLGLSLDEYVLHVLAERRPTPRAGQVRESAAGRYAYLPETQENAAREEKMGSRITIDLPAEVRTELDAASRVEGVSAGEIVGRALKNYFFVRRFRDLRAETRAHLRDTGQGDLTDDDVFRLVS